MTNSYFPVKLKLRIDWSELDYFGHVNNVSFFKYVQSARVNYWDAIGLTKMHKETNIGPLLASCNCNFRRILNYPGEITIHSRTEFIKNTSFSISHQIRDHENELAAEAQDVMVMFDFNSNEKVQFPIELKKRICELENREF